MNTTQPYRFDLGDEVLLDDDGWQPVTITGKDAPGYSPYPVYELKMPDGAKRWASELYLKPIDLGSSLYKGPLFQGSQCTCGLKFSREGGKHSDWCDLASRD